MIKSAALNVPVVRSRSVAKTPYDALVDFTTAILKSLFRTRNLRFMNRIVLPAAKVVFTITGILGFLAVCGGVGTWDYYAEIGQIVPAAEEKAATITMVVGIISLILSILLVNGSIKLIEFNKDVIRIRHRKYLEYKAKRVERMRWTIGDYLYKHRIYVDKDSDMYNYTYGEPARIRRIRLRRERARV